MTRFSKISLRLTKNRCFMTITNANNSVLTRIHLSSRPQKWNFMKKIVMLWVLCDQCIIIHFEFLKHNRPRNSYQCSQQIQRVHKNLLRKRPARFRGRKFLLLYNYPRPHWARITLETMLDLSKSVLRNPSYLHIYKTQWFWSSSFSTKW